MSNINDCTKFEDNWSKQSGLRVHTSFKNRWPDVKIFFQEVVSLDLKQTQKT